MISERPLFLEGEHFRVNRKEPKDDGHWWKYTTLRTTRVRIDFPIGETISFRDKNGIEWMRLTPTVELMERHLCCVTSIQTKR